MSLCHLSGVHNGAIIEIPVGIDASHTTLVECRTHGHLLKVLDRTLGLVYHHVKGDDAVGLGDVGKGKVAQLAVPRAQVGLGGIGDAGDIGRAGERITRTIIHAVKVSTEQFIIVVVGIGIDQVVLPHIDVGRVHTPYQHAGARQILVPLDALAVLDQEVLTLVGCVQAITHVALFKGCNGDGAFALDQGRLGKAQGIALKQAIASRVAAVVVLETAGHDRPSQGIGVVDTTAAVIVGIIEVRQAQAMAELMADGADAGDAAQ